MYKIIRLYIDICILQKGPQDVPGSRFLFWLTLALYSLVGLVMLRLSSGWVDSLLQLLTGILLLITFTVGVLFLKGKTDRLLPVLTALLGTDAIISFFALPVLATLATGRMSLFPELVYMGLILWSWLVMGHILRHALAVSLSFGMILAFVYIFSSVQVMELLFTGTLEITGE